MVPARASGLLEGDETGRHIGRNRPGVAELDIVDGKSHLAGLVGDGGLDLGGDRGAVTVRDGPGQVGNGVGNNLLGVGDELELAVDFAVSVVGDLGKVGVAAVEDGVGIDFTGCKRARSGRHVRMRFQFPQPVQRRHKLKPTLGLGLARKDTESGSSRRLDGLDLVHARDEDVEAGSDGLGETAARLDDPLLALRDDGDQL